MLAEAGTSWLKLLSAILSRFSGYYLDERIERTDGLIHEIVLELYGLTDEEIEIVEEAVTD